MPPPRLAAFIMLIFCATGGFGSRLYAADSVGFDVLSGKGTSGFDVNGSLDLKPKGFTNPFEASLSYAHQQTDIGTNDKTNQYTGGVSHTVNDQWDWQTEVTYWKDDINDIHYVGPTAGFTYTWTDGSSPSPHPQIQQAGASDEETRPSDKNEDDAEPAAKDEIAALSINADLFFYGTEVETSSVTRRVFDKKLSRFVKESIPAGAKNEKVTQFHPSATFEKPLFDSTATPYLTAGHYFYSQDPAALESIAGRPRFASAGGQLNGLVAGFLKNNGEVGIRASLPFNIDSDFRLGAAQETTDNTWSTTQGITFTRTFFDHVKAKVDWSRAIQSGVSNDLFTGGLTYLF